MAGLGKMTGLGLCTAIDLIVGSVAAGMGSVGGSNPFGPAGARSWTDLGAGMRS